MDKSIRKAFLLGFGMTLLTKDAVEREVKGFMKEHRITEKESKRIASKIVKESMKHRKDIERRIRSAESMVKKEIKKRL